MSSDCPEITKMILDIIYGDEVEGNGISTTNKTAKRLRIAGVYASAFFIELAEYFIFLIFKTVVYV